MIRFTLSAGAYLITANVVQALVVFVSNLIVLRFLAPEEFGRFAVTLAGTAIIVGLLSLRLNVAILRTPAEEFSPQRQQLYFSAVVMEAMLIALVLLAWTVGTGRSTAADLTLVAGLLLQSFANNARGFLERGLRYRKIAIAETATVVAAQVVSVAVVIGTESVTALYVRELATGIASLIGLWCCGGLVVFPVRWLSGAEWRVLVRDSRDGWLDASLESAFQRITVLAVGGLISERGAGLFYLAQRLAVIPHQILYPLGRVAMGWFSQNPDTTERERGRNRLIAVLALPLAVCAVATLILSEPLIVLLFGAHWQEAVPVLQAMSGAILFSSLFEITRGYAMLHKQTTTILAGRTMQFVGFALPLVAFELDASVAPATFGLGLSLAAALAFSVQFFLLRRRAFQ